MSKGDPQVLFKTLPKFIIAKRNISILNPNSIKPIFKEDKVFESHFGDFLRLHDPKEKIIIMNRLNLQTKRSQTVAQLTRAGTVVWEKTSDYIASVIGQDNYEIVFSSLCSVISQEFKIRSILALLTEPKSERTQSSQSDFSGVKIMIDNEVQTDETCIEIKKPQRRIKRQKLPYVVTDTVPEKVSKVVIYPENFESFTQSTDVMVKCEKMDVEPDNSFLNTEHDSEHLPMLKFDEDSRDSLGNLSSLSVTTTQELLNEPLSLIDQNTEPAQSTLTMLDGTILNIPCKIEDDFHVATPEILNLVAPEHRRKLLWYQAYTDWKYCLTRDNDDNLPIHLAVWNDDVHLLKRQCLVLKTRNESVDITNGDNMTALQMSILADSPSCTALLVQLGASPLAADEEYRSCFHLAAEAGARHLRAVLDKCRQDPLSILRSSDELWKPEVALKSKEAQVKYLMHKVCTSADSQGYTPLMLASKLGNHEAVQLLVDAAPETVDHRASSSGSTALYLAVAAACTDSEQRGNKSKVSEDFKKTIEQLLEAGADPEKENYSGSNVNSLLFDFNNSELSMITARKRTVINCKDLDTKDSKPFMLIKESDGTLMNIKDQIKMTQEINKIKNEIRKEAISKQKKTTKEKPIILENKRITKSSEEFVNTYRNFVNKLKNPLLTNDDKESNKPVYDDEKPSTSKAIKASPLKITIRKPTVDPLRMPMSSATDTIIGLKKSNNSNVKIKVEVPDPIAIATTIKQENTETKAPIEKQSYVLKSDKRKIVVKVGTRTDTETVSSKRQKRNSNKSDKT